MKIKIYILVSCLLICCHPFSADAYWYQCGIAGCAPTVSLGVGISNCTADLFLDAIGPTIAEGTGPAGDTGFIYANGQTQVLAG